MSTLARNTLFAFAVALLIVFSSSGFAQSVDDLRAAAQSGEADAQFKLGLAYDSGDGVLPNIETALEWYTKAAEQGHAEAHYYIALTYDFGDRVIEDNVAAVRSYTSAANLDWGPAQSALGLCYENGNGVPADVAKARYWYERAAQNGDADGFGYLADLYNRGVGVAQDSRKALELLEQGAVGGSFYSQAELAKIYLLGAAELRDVERGLAWLLIAEEGAADDGERSEVREVFNQISVGDAEMRSARRSAVKLQSSLFGESTLADGDALIRNRFHSTLQKGLSALGYFDGKKDGESSPQLIAAIEEFASDWDIETDEISDPDILLQIGAAIAFQVMEREAGTDTGLSVGSGFYVSAPGHIVTNAHVVEGCSTVRLEQGTELTVQAVDDASDLALLSGPSSGVVSTLPLRAGVGLRVAENVWTAGFPLSGYLTSDVIVSNGTVMALSGLGEDRRRVQLSAPVQPGNSGGPILDSSARVVGVVVSGLNSLGVAAELGDLPENVNFGVSLGTLQSFLDTHSIDYEYQSETRVLGGPEIARRAQASAVAIFCD